VGVFFTFPFPLTLALSLRERGLVVSFEGEGANLISFLVVRKHYSLTK